MKSHEPPTSPGFRFVLRLAGWIVFFILAALLASLGGCATTGVEMSEAEAKACKEQGCTAWTVQELRGLVNEAFRAGYNAGVKSL